MSEKAEPLVTVIIPVRNNERTIGEVLKALGSQTYSNLEIIVIDGSSDDRTADIASQFDVKILTEEARGPNYARNLGIENAKGEFLLFIDGDCKPDSGWVERILKPFSSPKVGVVGGSINVWNSSSFLSFIVSSLV